MGQQFLSSTANIRTTSTAETRRTRPVLYEYHQENQGSLRYGFWPRCKAGGDGGRRTGWNHHGRGDVLRPISSDCGADSIEVMGGSWKPVPDIDDIPSTADKPGRMLGLSRSCEKGGSLHAGRKEKSCIYRRRPARICRHWPRRPWRKENVTLYLWATVF